MSLFDWLFGHQQKSENRPEIASVIGDEEYDFDIVGESRYQDNLNNIVGGKNKDGAEKYVKAVLIAEPENRYDKNAVRVDIQGMTVGYIPREDAQEIQQDLFDISSQGKAHCNAVIVGGWKDDASEGNFGVRLDLEVPLETRD